MLTVTAIRALRRIADGKPAFPDFACDAGPPHIIARNRREALLELRARRLIGPGPALTATGRAFLVWLQSGTRDTTRTVQAERYGMPEYLAKIRLERARREL